MVTDQKHSSDSIASEQEVIRHTKKLAQIFGLNEQNAEVYSALSGENRALKKQLEDYHSQHNTLEKRIKRLERDVKSLETELEDLNECVDRKTVVDLIHETVPSLIGKKDVPHTFVLLEDPGNSIDRLPLKWVILSENILQIITKYS